MSRTMKISIKCLKKTICCIKCILASKSEGNADGKPDLGLIIGGSVAGILCLGILGCVAYNCKRYLMLNTHIYIYNYI